MLNQVAQPVIFMKTLVTYFSRTGQTSRIAKEIAMRCNAHLDPIHAQAQGMTWLAGWRYNWQALVHSAPPIQRPVRNPANYDLVVIGVPISRAGLAPPVRSYIRQYAARIQQIAFFCAEGEGREERGFAELSKLCGKQPKATLAVARKCLPAIASRAQLIDFVDSIRGEGLDTSQAR
ncbi:MAG: hypothetical protein LH632_18880 [Rhodoferax sp.]|nr:hypothetical protein [Rhodoferax sp.]